MHFIKQYWRWMLVGWIAFVFIQSLFFKFSNSLETQHIFGTLGDWLGLQWFSDYGGYMVGLAELIAALIMFTRYWAWGALLAFEIMCGAIVFHLFTPLGVKMPVYDQNGMVVGDDAGLLFVMACFTCASALTLVVNDWVSENSQIRKVFNRSSGS